MPYVIAPDGTAKYIPGVYTGLTVISDLPGPLPEFHIPVLVGTADEGHPFDANDNKYASEASFQSARLCRTTAAVESYFGRGSPLATAMRYAKRHGLPFAYVIAVNALTRASVIATSSGPVNEAYVFAKKFGAPGGYIKVAYGSNQLTVTPVKRFSKLTATPATTAKRIYVTDNSWISVGQTLTIGDNDSAAVTKVVAGTGYDFDSAGQKRFWIDLTATIGTAFAIADDAMVVEYGTAIVSPTFTRGQEAIDWLNDTAACPLGAHPHANFSDALWVTQAAGLLKELATWATATAGESPASTSGQHDDLITRLDASEWDNFLLVNGTIPQAWCVIDGSSTVHGAWRDWATAKRTEGYPVSITVGTEWGDTELDAGDDTDPKHRAAALNSEDVMLCVGGLDYLDAYLSFGPAVWGRRIGGGLNHNLTNDELVFEAVEKKWDERNAGELTALCRAGVVTQRLRTAGRPSFVVSEGLSTLQNNASVWNTGTNDTCLVQQRDLADFALRVFSDDLDGTIVGADGVDRDAVIAVLKARADLSLFPKGYIRSFAITSVARNDGGSGWDVVPSVSFPTPTDFVTVDLQVHIGG